MQASSSSSPTRLDIFASNIFLIHLCQLMSHVENQRPYAAAMAGKTARACDGCARRRARWYCAADDAFLCQGCDASVHSAHPLARRHCRLRLNTSSSLSAASDADESEPVPSWLRGFKRKARTPRPHLHVKRGRGSSTVPELADTSVEETEDEEQQLLYCVPVFDPALAEFRSPQPLDDSNASSADELAKPCTPASTSTIDSVQRMATSLPSEMELAEFAANMESLLGSGDDSFSMEKLGLMNSLEGEDDDNNNDNDNDNVIYRFDDGGRLKMEDADETDDCQVELEIDMTRETLELNFNWPGSSTAEEDEFEEEKVEAIAEQEEEAAKRAKLRLDYDAVISAWSRHGTSPWTDGERPQINVDGGWAEYLGMWGDATGGGHGSEGRGGHVDVGRQARVSRYREKRRTRLFAKKIRYEVRKLNAEKRPRMKGRFVKRAPGFAY